MVAVSPDSNCSSQGMGQTQSFQVFLEALCVGQGLDLDEISKFHVSVSKIGVVIQVGKKRLPAMVTSSFEVTDEKHHNHLVTSDKCRFNRTLNEYRCELIQRVLSIN
jgi:hypothetical protein